MLQMKALNPMNMMNINRLLERNFIVVGRLQEVEHVNYSGQATTLLGLVSYSTTYSNACGLAQGWYPYSGLNADIDTNAGFKTQQGYLIGLPNPKGSFQCAIPMKHIFGFMDDYSKVTYGMRYFRRFRRDKSEI